MDAPDARVSHNASVNEPVSRTLPYTKCPDCSALGKSSAPHSPPSDAVCHSRCAQQKASSTQENAGTPDFAPQYAAAPLMKPQLPPKGSSGISIMNLPSFCSSDSLGTTVSLVSRLTRHSPTCNDKSIGMAHREELRTQATSSSSLQALFASSCSTQSSNGPLRK